jgi:uncharacterized RDD family membrane protein YckC
MYCQQCGANVADGVAFCTSCGRPLIGYSVGQSGGASSVVTANAPVPYAGFWLRLVAALLDGVILGIPFVVIYLALIASALPQLLRNANAAQAVVATLLPRIIFFFMIVIVAEWLYWALLESSSWQATVGKKALGLYVADLDGTPITLGKASARFWTGRGLTVVPGLGGLYFLVDCICAGVTEKKQAVHDMIAGCLVLRKS